MVFPTLLLKQCVHACAVHKTQAEIEHNVGIMWKHNGYVYENRKPFEHNFLRPTFFRPFFLQYCFKKLYTCTCIWIMVCVFGNIIMRYQTYEEGELGQI